MTSLQKCLEDGRVKLGQGDYPGALARAESALSIDESSFEAIQLRGRALYLLGREEEALQALRQAHVVLHRLLPGGPERDPLDAFTQPHGAPPADSLGSDALDTLVALRERHRFDAELTALLAALAEDAGRYAIAREAYESLIADTPDQREAWEGLVHVLSHHDLDAALDATRRALAYFPDHALFYEFHGYLLYRRRKFAQAIEAYRQAIAHGADHPENYQALVQNYLALDDTGMALRITRSLVSGYPNAVEANRFAIEVALRCNDHDMAMRHAHQLVRLQPAWAETYCFKAWVELAGGHWDQAERTLRLGFHKAVDGIFAMLELVDLLVNSTALPEALRVAELACALAPDHPEACAARGKVLREMGDYPHALQAFHLAATLAPQDDAYQTWVGVIYDNLGEFDRAMRQFNLVLTRHPHDVWTLGNRGLTYMALERFPEAEADFTRGLQLDARNAPLFFWRACARARMGQVDPALRDLRRAVDLSDDIPLWIEHESSLAVLQDDPRYRTFLRWLGGEE